MPDPISFGVANLVGELSQNPTALDFSKTGNPVLFVAQQDGNIYRYVVERQLDGPDPDTTDDFVATDVVLIDVIPQSTQNFDDDGTLNNTQQRQVTGMAVTQDASGNDVLYMSSSDWRIAVGTDTGLNTNSGQVHKIVLDPDTGAVLSNVAILRGLPRSEENHSTNGLDIAVDPVTGDTYLWLAVGGITNKGAPGNNFAGTVDFALSGAIIKINLTDLESYDIRTDANGSPFILDLSTLDDPTRSNVDLATLNIQNLAADPNFTLDDNGNINGVLQPDWAGGNNGLNQAKIGDHVLVSDGGQLTLVSNPVAVHAPGYRNSYDVLITVNGQIYTWDNGPNGGWGGQPIAYGDGQIVDDWTTDLATNEFNEAGSSGFGDQLHYLGEVGDLYGPYGGHASPIRAAKEVLEAAFNTDGTYKGATANDPIIADGQQLFADETDARAFLASLLIIYEEQGAGNWVDVTGTTGLPPDLYDVVSGYDWAHPGGSISDPLDHFDGTSIMDGTVYSPEAELFDNTEDGSLVTTPETTNGLAEYRGSFFGGALQGAIIGASFNETLYFAMPTDTDSDGRVDAASIIYTLTDFGSNPLAVATLPDWGLSATEMIDNNGDGLDDFSGLIIAANHGNDNVVFFIPGGTPIDPSNDLDLDGLDNIVDSHVGDPTDGKGVVVGLNETERWDFELNNPSSTPAGAVPPGDSIAGDIGINAAWRNNIIPAVDNGGDPNDGLYDGGVFNLGGASSFVSIDRAYAGTAEGPSNSQQDVLGIGFMSQGASNIAITTEMVNIFTYSLNTDAPARTWDGGEKVGLMVGPGDQSNFVEAAVAVIDDAGTIRYGVQLLVEENDSFTTSFIEIPGIEAPIILGLGDPNFQVAIDIDLAFGNETAVARARYVDDGVYTAWVSTGSLPVPPAVIESLKGQYNNLGSDTGTVVGMLSTTDPGDDSFASSWDWIEVENTGTEGEVVHRWVAGSSNVAAIDGGMVWDNDTSVIVAGPTNVATHNIPTLDASVPATTPLGIFAQERWDPPTGDSMQLEFAVDPGDYAIRLFMGNGAGSTSQIGERIFDVLIEGQTFLDNIDLVASFGHDVGGMFEWVGSISDGVADIDFASVIQNPLINGVEIIALNTQPNGPVISVADAQADEDAGMLTVTISADITLPANDDVQVQYEIRPLVNGATPEVDYTVANATYDAQSGNYTASGDIAGGSSDLSVTITLLDDTFDEPDEMFEVVITSVSGGNSVIGDGTAVVTILDNDDPSGTGAVTLGIRETSDNVQISNFGPGSFVLTNVGDKVVTQVEIDVTNAILTDAVFDPFGLAGDTVSKPLTIDSDGNTGVNAPDNSSYVGTGGIAGYEGLVLTFDQNVNGGFEAAETMNFSVDMDPNSIAGAKKSLLEQGSSPFWDVGGVSGAELIGSTFIVTYSDGSTSTGMLHGTDTQGGSKGLASQSSPGTQGSLVVNGLAAGEVGMYDASTFTAVVDGPANSVMRVVLLKGFVQPVTNEFYNGNAEDQQYAPQLDAQLDALRASAFPANNAAEIQTVDITLTGSPQDISNMFDLTGLADYDFSGEDELPLAMVAGIIDPANSNLPLGPVSAPIYLDFDDGGPDTTAPTVQSATAPDIGAAEAGTTSTTVAVVFADNAAVDVSSIDIADISVTGPAGPLTVTGVNVDNGSNGSPRTATYTVTAPGGTWDTADDGAYTVSLAGGEVLDTSGNAVVADPTLTSFTADLSTSGGEPFRVEAETFNIVQGFNVKNNGSASAGQYLQAGGSGEQIARYTFMAAAGSHDITLGYYDEADGQSQLSVRVNGIEVDSFVWNLDAAGNNANGLSFTTRVLPDIDLSAGDVLELAGFPNGGEPLRIDYVEFTPMGPGGGDTILPMVQSAAAPDLDNGDTGTTTTDVTVVFTDNVAIDVSSIDVSDITVTGPAGPLTVTGVNVDTPTNGTPRTATYTVAAPGGTWEETDDGNYDVALVASALIDTSGNAIAAQPTLASFTVDMADTTLPMVQSAAAPDLDNGDTGTTTTDVTVVFTDNVAIDVSSIDVSDITVTGPAGPLTVTGVNVDTPTNGTPRTATYTVAAPGGTWEETDDGNYDVALVASALIDTSGNAIAAQPTLASFTVDMADTTLPMVQSAAAPDLDNGDTGTTTTDVTVVFTDNVAIDVSSIDVSDITVTGPAGPLTVTGVNVDTPTNGTPRTATYTVAAPGGTWEETDNGNYDVALVASALIDTSGNAIAAQPTLASFTVDMGTAGGEPFRVEAETFNIVQGFNVKNNGSASAGQYLQAGGSGEQIARYTFMAAAGSHDITLGYYDEADGQSQLSVRVNGIEVDSFVWNLDAAGNNANGLSFTTRVLPDIDLSAGDVLELAGFPNGGEPLRIDYVEFTPMGPGGGDTILPMVQSAAAPDLDNGDTGTTTTDVTVVFTDNVAIDVSSIDVSDITVTGPAGPLTVTGVNVDTPTNGTPRTATYTVAAPGGTWEETDDGNYDVALVASALIDTSGNAIAAQPTLASFTVDMADTTLPMVQSAAAPDLDNGDTGTTTTDVTVVFTDNVAIDVSSIDVSDITVTGPAGPLTVTGVNVDTPTNGTPRTATYTVAAPGGTWEETDDGNYDVALVASALIDTSGNAIAAQPTLASFTVDMADTILPMVQSAAAPDLDNGDAGTTTTDVTVVFTDNVAIDVSSIDVSDITVTGPAGPLTVTGVNVDTPTNGTPRTATYTVAAPGGTWEETDNGNYDVALVASALIDTSGNAIAAQPTLASFTVDMADTILPMVQSAAAPDLDNGDTGTTTTDVTVVFTDNVAIDVSSIDVSDITVTGPAGPLTVTGVNVDTPTNGTPRTATYTVAAPGGTWEETDNGNYDVALVASALIDTSGNAIAAQPTLASFTVDMGTAPPGPDPFRVEAETLNIVQSFNIKNNGFASNGQHLQAGGSGVQTANLTFVVADGIYDVALGYFDESDGQSQLSILLNGIEIDSFIFDEDLGGGNANGASLAERTLAAVELQIGDVLELTGTPDAGEPLRIDYLDFTYMDELFA